MKSVHILLIALLSSAALASSADVAVPSSRAAQAAAFSEYAGAIHAVIRRAFLIHRFHLGGMEQAMESKNVDELRNQAESMKESTERLRDEIERLPMPDLPDQDAEAFEAAHDAAIDLMLAILDLDLDFAVYAHTGFSSEGQYKNDTAAIAKARNRYDKQLIDTYKYFGIPRSKIDPVTFRLRARK